MTDESKRTRYRIGRNDGKEITHAFFVERREDSGIKLTEIADSVTDDERQAVLLAFGTKHRAAMGVYPGKGVMGTAIHEVEPGSLLHFRVSVYNLPAPFVPYTPRPGKES